MATLRRLTAVGRRLNKDEQRFGFMSAGRLHFGLVPCTNREPRAVNIFDERMSILTRKSPDQNRTLS
jgi:hypothetical protein